MNTNDTNTTPTKNAECFGICIDAHDVKEVLEGGKEELKRRLQAAQNASPTDPQPPTDETRPPETKPEAKKTNPKREHKAEEIETARATVEKINALFAEIDNPERLSSFDKFLPDHEQYLTKRDKELIRRANLTKKERADENAAIMERNRQRAEVRKSAHKLLHGKRPSTWIMFAPISDVARAASEELKRMQTKETEKIAKAEKGAEGAKNAA